MIVMKAPTSPTDHAGLTEEQEARWISLTQQHIRTGFTGESSGHDWHHVERVWKTAIRIAVVEGGYRPVIELGALLHDLGDWKFRDGDETAGARESRQWLESIQVAPRVIEQVAVLVGEISYKGAGVKTPTTSLEAAIVQDADRLDAMGAIGIARAFAYGGHRLRPLYTPDAAITLHDSFASYKRAAGCTISHFHEKLLLLKERMNTPTGRKLADHRHRFMLTYLQQFHAEWDGEA